MASCTSEIILADVTCSWFKNMLINAAEKTDNTAEILFITIHLNKTVQYTKYT